MDNIGNIKQELSVYRLSIAKECLDTTKLLFDLKKFKDSNNRAYYSALYAIKAVLAIEGVDFKRHKDVIGYFNKTYVKEEIFPRELGRKLAKMAVIRELADYKDFYVVSKEEAEEQLKTAEYAIELVEEYLKDKNKA